MKYLALLGVLLFALACGGNDRPGVLAISDGGSSGRMGHVGGGGSTSEGGASGSAGARDDAGEGGELERNDLAPVIQITAPTPVADPDSGALLTDPQVSVTCLVTKSPKPNAQAILGSSVKIQMFDAEGTQIGVDGSVISTGVPDEYSASFLLTKVPSGLVSFVCSASDLAVPANSAKAEVSTFYDAGPAISLAEPLDKSARPLGEVRFRFSVLPNPLSETDAGAAVDTVSLKVNGVVISDVMATPGMKGYYQASVDLNDPMLFTPTPVGEVPIVITAKNKRGTSASTNYSFIVDSVGPIIKIVSPPVLGVQIVGGVVPLQFTVTDELGGSQVDPDSVTVAINLAAPVHFEQGNYWNLSPDGKTFIYSFNTLNYPSQLQVKIAVNAYDKAGNRAAGVSASYYLDNEPPIVDMQPPSIQEWAGDGTNARCSAFFDPVGDSPDDLDVVPSVRYFRALIWDEGNLVDGQNPTFFSGNDDEAGVRLYFQENSAAPLLKNKQGIAGGRCNEIADPTLPFVSLFPIAPAGDSYFPANAPAVAGCKQGSDTDQKFLCNRTSSLTRVIQHETVTSGTKVSVIYGIAGDGPTGALCTGGQQDITNIVSKDGWFCASVVAQDKIGNRAVSAPLRLCLDAQDSAGPTYVGHPDCVSGLNAPSCIPAAPANCELPNHFDKRLTTIP